MKTKNRFLISLGLVLFFLGSFAGILFFAGLVWPSLEATFYFGYNGGADTTLKLSCPRIITAQDHAVVTATISNKVEKPISPRLEVQLSGPAIQIIKDQFTIQPGQTDKFTWELNQDNLAFGHLILAQVYQFASFKTPTAMADCGALYLFISTLSGEEIYLLAFILSMVSIVAGILLWRVGSATLTGLDYERLSGMIWLGSIVLIGIVLGTIGQWLIGTLVLAVAVLLFVIQLSRRLSPV